MCGSEAEVRELLEWSLGVGETGRLVTKKSGRGGGDADEYIAYARFVEEGACGYATQNFGGRRDDGSSPLLPPAVNGRYASCSPEHTLCRVGGDGARSGAGGSGVAAWGVGKRGQLGAGRREDASVPLRLTGGVGYGVRIVQVSAGGGLVRVAHSLLLTSTGRVLSFGTAQYGQLGHGYGSGRQLTDELRPRYVDALSRVRCTCVSAGELHSAAVTADGDLYSWGDGFCGQLGLGDKRPQLLPRQVTLGGLEDECVSSVSCGNRHTLCVTDDGEAFSFGLGHFGVLGRAYTPFEYDADAAVGVVEVGDVGGGGGGGGVPPPMAMAPALNRAAVVPPSAGGGQGQRGGAIADETRAQLDLIANLTLDDSSDQCMPIIIDSLGGINIVGASAGHRHSMFLDEDGGLYTCGSGASGELGHRDYLGRERPVRVKEFADSDARILQMSAGVDVCMAVTTRGDVYAWGKSDGGRIGLDLAPGRVSIPRRVSFPSEDFRALDVECGYVHSVVVGLDGTVHVCGGVGTDGDEDGQGGGGGGGQGQGQGQGEDCTTDGRPARLADFNIWHRLPEPREEKKSGERWKKYGKYELRGRTKMMAEAERWNV